VRLVAASAAVAAVAADLLSEVVAVVAADLLSEAVAAVVPLAVAVAPH
jgi:hypothetical protein